MQTFLTIIIPCFNEAANFSRGTLDTVIKYLKIQKYTWELLLINDGSTDNTYSLISAFAKKNSGVVVVNNPHMGKAATVMTGAKLARGQIILFSDMDQATPISESEKLISKIKDGYSIVIGSRSGRKGAPVIRQVLAYGNVIMRSIILRLPFRDTQCGFKAFTKKAATEVFSKIGSVHVPKIITGPAVNAGFDMELLYLGQKLGFKIAEVPVEWSHQETKRVSFVRDAKNSLRELLLIRMRAITNAYKLE